MDAKGWLLVDACNGLPKIATRRWPLGVFDQEVWSLDGASLSIFAPTPTDFQTAHQQDEIYCVARGSATLHLEKRDIPAQVGAAIVVAAGTPHRFIDMSDDFAAWVIFLPRGRRDEVK